MADYHPLTQDIIRWSKRALLAGDRQEAGLGLRDLLCGLAALEEAPEIRNVLSQVLGLKPDQNLGVNWPDSVKADLTGARAIPATEAVMPLQDDLRLLLAGVAGRSPELAPDVLVPAIIGADHPMTSEFRRLNRVDQARPTPLLDQVGLDLTREAREGRIGPIIGRESLMEMVVETLCRSVKRNPLLIGPAGVGKTAIAERLAQRIAAGQVPEPLRGTRLIQLQPSSLMARCSSVQQFVEQVDTIIGEASQPAVLLFIDEVHAMIGVGGATGSTDLASLLKPALARGAIACVAATTDDEFRRHMQADPALERRFVPLRVQELSAAETLVVLHGVRDDLQMRRHVAVPDAVLSWMVNFAERHLRNRQFPDKAIDVLDQTVAHAVMAGRSDVDIDMAASVAHRLVAVQQDLGSSLADLGRRLAERFPGAGEVLDDLVTRIDVAMGGLDVRPERPNAVVLLSGRAAEVADAVAADIAELALGGRNRVVSIDFADFPQEHDLSRFVGSAPGFVGYRDPLPIHRLQQTPSCVLVCRHIDACHRRIRDVLSNAIDRGVLTDAQGHMVYLSDAIVLLTMAQDSPESKPALGFGSSQGLAAGPSLTDDRRLEQLLDTGLLAQIDLRLTTASMAGTVAEHIDAFGVQPLLQGLADRYRAQGVVLIWDDSLSRWLAAESTSADQRSLERLLDLRLVPVLYKRLADEPSAAGGLRLLVSCTDGIVTLAEAPAES